MAVGESNLWHFLLLAGGGCFVGSMNGAEQADKGHWLVFPLTILY